MHSTHSSAQGTRETWRAISASTSHLNPQHKVDCAMILELNSSGDRGIESFPTEPHSTSDRPEVVSALVQATFVTGEFPGEATLKPLNSRNLRKFVAYRSIDLIAKCYHHLYFLYFLRPSSRLAVCVTRRLQIQKLSGNPPGEAQTSDLLENAPNLWA